MPEGYDDGPIPSPLPSTDYENLTRGLTEDEIKKVKPIGEKSRPVRILGSEQESYYEKVMALTGDAGPGLHHIIVSHDSWCDRLKGGMCNCEPQVKRAA